MKSAALEGLVSPFSAAGEPKKAPKGAFSEE
jgi:hypothetical protein